MMPRIERQHGEDRSAPGGTAYRRIVWLQSVSHWSSFVRVRTLVAWREFVGVDAVIEEGEHPITPERRLLKPGTRPDTNECRRAQAVLRLRFRTTRSTSQSRTCRSARS
jgi:hypothetical protein